MILKDKTPLRIAFRQLEQLREKILLLYRSKNPTTQDVRYIRSELKRIRAQLQNNIKPKHINQERMLT